MLYTNIDSRKWKYAEAARARLREEWDVEPEVPVILFSGRICPQKQPRVLARTLGELGRRDLAFRAVIAGDGEERDGFERLLRSEGVSKRVVLLGEVGNEEIPELMSAADLFFLPSEWEGIALVLFEAMAMQLPIVGAVVGGQAELVTPDCGLLLPRGSEDEEVAGYADALESLIRDPERRRAMADRARQRIEEHFQLDQMVDGFVDLVEQAAQRRDELPYEPLPDALADHWAAQAVEYLRVTAVADQLWVERTLAKDAPADSVMSRLQAQDLLDHIEKSGSWQRVVSLHRSGLGRAAGRLGLSTNLEEIDGTKDPQRRLARIQSTLSYRLIRLVKRTPLHRAWARWRYGSTHDTGRLE